MTSSVNDYNRRFRTAALSSTARTRAALPQVPEQAFERKHLRDDDEPERGRVEGS
jgi:hypothetical protein